MRLDFGAQVAVGLQSNLTLPVLQHVISRLLQIVLMQNP